MKIAYVASEINPVPPVKGGAVEHWIYEVAKRLAHNNEVYSFCIHVPQLKNIKDNNGVNILTYKISLIGKIMLCTYKLPFKNDTDYLYYLPYSFWCSLKIKRIKADLIHIHARPQFVPILRLLNPRAKIFLHVHNVSNIELGGKLWKKSLFDKVDRVITCSEYLKQEVIKRYPYLTDKLKVLYNGVDTEKFISNQEISEKELKEKYRIRPEDLVLLFVGRLVEYKGVHVLIDALKDILKIIPNVKLIIVGGVTYSNNQETPYIRSLKEMTREIKNNIIFTGYIEHSQIPNFINLADIFVVPSLWEEPFGVVTIIMRTVFILANVFAD